MKQFLEFVAQQLVVDQGLVVLRQEITANGSDFFLALPASELGRIIGKQGQTIRAIRSLLAGATEVGKRVRFEVEEQRVTNS